MLHTFTNSPIYWLSLYSIFTFAVYLHQKLVVCAIFGLVISALFSSGYGANFRYTSTIFRQRKSSLRQHLFKSALECEDHYNHLAAFFHRATEVSRISANENKSLSTTVLICEILRVSKRRRICINEI